VRVERFVTARDELGEVRAGDECMNDESHV
jgi:hypothetical protein